MAEPFVGEIRLVGFSFAPRGWAFCDGQLLPISQNNALFSLFGTTYGGDGRTTFALPDLRGRVPIHKGQGPGLSRYVQGQKGGAETVTLTVAQIPAHSHNHSGNLRPGDNPVGTSNAVDVRQNIAPNATFNSQNTGGGQSHENRPPYLVLNFVVALVGLYPSRQ